MNTNIPFERRFAAWMADEAALDVPVGAIDEALSVTSRQRPRPRWLALVRETPMRTQSRVLVGSPTRRLALVLAVLALVAAVAVAGALLLNNQTAAADWSGYRGGPGHAGVGASGPLGAPVLKWQYHAKGAANRGIAIADGVAVVPTDDGTVLAIDLANGALRWSVTTSGAPGAAFVAEGRAYVGDAEGVISAFDVETGASVWRSRTAIAPSPDVTAGDGSLFVPTPTGELVALDLGNGSERWRTAVSSDLSSLHQPAFDAGRVFVAYGASIAAVDAATGRVAWTASTNGQQTAAAVAAGGRVYVGVPPDQAAAGGVLAFDERTGGPLWTLGEGLYSPSVDGSIGYAGGPDGLLAAIDAASGSVRWRTSFNGLIRSPSIASGMVFVAADAEHAVHALDAGTGGELWKFDVDGSMDCCLAVAQGLVVVGTTSGSIYAIGGDGAAQSAAPVRTPGPSVAVETVAPTQIVAPSIATLAWAQTADDPDFVSAALGRAPDGNLWVADPRNGRFAIFSPDGKFLEFWGEPGSGHGQFNLITGEGNPWGTVAFAKDGSFFVLDVGNRRVQAYDAGRRLLNTWGGLGTDPGKFSNPVAIQVGPDGSVSVLDDRRGVIETYDAAGKVLGSFSPLENVSNGSGGFAIDADGNFYVGAVTPNEIRIFDRTGASIGSFPTAPASGPAAPGGIAVDKNGHVFITLGPDGSAYGALVFSTDGIFIGGFGPRGQAEGQLAFAWGVVADDEGSVYVTEMGGDPGIPSPNRIQKFKLELPAP
jgi:eukaryotic-like serine/threonine-protein kinase